jgi:hypothetical protein
VKEEVATKEVEEFDNIFSPLLDLSTWGRKRFVNYDKITRLFQMDISYLRTLGELKTELLSHDEFKMVPSTKHLRVWDHSRILKKDDQTLRQQYIGADTPITIQILSIPDEMITGDEAVLYVHRRTKEKKFESFNEVCFGGSSNLEMATVLSEKFQIPLDYLLVARYTFHLGVWEVAFEGVKSLFESLPSDNEVPKETNSSDQQPSKSSDTPPSSNSNSKNTKSVRTKAFVSDGTIIAVKDLRDDPSNEDDFALRPIRLLSSALADEQFSGGGSTMRGVRVREANLVIHVSDDEYEFQDVDDD